MTDTKQLKENELERVAGGSYWINNVEYQYSWKDGWTRCPNCSCNGQTYFYTNENKYIYDCETGVYKCGVCGNIWNI